MQSKRCVQPLRGYLALRGITNAELARGVGRTPHYVGRCLNGFERPSEGLLDDISGFLGEDVRGLFVDGDAEADRIAHELVTRTRAASGVPKRLEDDRAVETVAAVLRGPS